MVEIIKEEVGFQKKGENYIWSINVDQEITPAEFESNKQFLNNNIKTLKEELAKIDIDVEIKKFKESKKKEKEIKQEAYDHFDKYIQDQIREIKENRDKTKMQIHQYLNKFDEISEMQLGKMIDQISTQKERMEIQLKNDEASLKHYETFETNNK